MPGTFENPRLSRHAAAERTPVKHRQRRIAVIAGGAALLLAAGIAVVTTANAAVGAIPSGAIKAASFAAQSGARVESTMDAGGGQNVGWLANGDWMRYDGVDLGQPGALTMSMRVAAAVNDGGTVEVRIHALTGPVIATIPITATGGWQSWVTKTDVQPSPGGTHEIFVLIKATHPWDFVNINWFTFQGSGAPAPAPVPTATSASAMPMPMPSETHDHTSTPPPVGGWIPADQAAWNAQLAAFQAMTPRPIPVPNLRQNSEFNATCVFSHSAADDPIVFPGQKGASHMHSFVGNDGTNADTTTEDLMKFTASSCQPVEDHSAYWIPTLYENDQPVQPRQVIVYYGSLLADKSKTVPMPIRATHDRRRRQEAGAYPARRGEPFLLRRRPAGGRPQHRRKLAGLRRWNPALHPPLPRLLGRQAPGQPGHKEHVSFGAGGKCPDAFPIPIPSITFSISYPTSGTRTASGWPPAWHRRCMATPSSPGRPMR